MSSLIGIELMLSRVDLAEVVDDLAQALVLVGSEVEALQPVDAVGLSGGDVVEVVLHLRGEVVLDEVAEVLLEQANDREGDVSSGRAPGRAA